MGPPALSILGLILVTATALALGEIVSGPSPAGFSRAEHRAIRHMAGAGLLSMGVMLLAWAGVVSPAVFIGISAISLGRLLWPLRGHIRAASMTTFRLSWPSAGAIGASLGLLVFGVMYTIVALAPETSPDGSGYHLGAVHKYLLDGKMSPQQEDMYWMLYQGGEMLYLFASAIGTYSSAALLHLTFLADLAILVAGFASRHGRPQSGIAASILIVACPVIGRCATTAYVDVMVAAILFSAFVLLEAYSRSFDRRTVLLGSLLLGFGISVKITAVVALGLLISVTLWAYFARRENLSSLVAGAAIVALYVAPWSIRNWLWYQNPVAPMFNRWFPNDHVFVSLEEGWRQALQALGGTMALSE